MEHVEGSDWALNRNDGDRGPSLIIDMSPYLHSYSSRVPEHVSRTNGANVLVSNLGFGIGAVHVDHSW